MSEILGRSFRVLEHLAQHPQGCTLSSVAAVTGMPLSATHRLLADLCRAGYVRQSRDQGEYALTVKLVALGLNFLGRSGVVDVAQPLLDELAAQAGDLVRLAVVDGDDLTFVAKAQGAVSGLRYDPDMGLSVRLSCSAAGHAWLATMTDEQALARVERQGFGEPADFGPKAPTTAKALLAYVHAARRRGFSFIAEVFAPGMASMGAPVRVNDETIGVLTIAGPAVRLTEQRMASLGPLLLETAGAVAAASGGSEMLRKRALWR
jgi:IclR family acetate operon transcriptional repressor